MLKILYTVAKDKNGGLIKAMDAEKGLDYFCPVCNSNLILRKSGNTAKGSKRPHFAHKALTPNCTPETALHFSFKNLAADKMKEHIKNNIPLPFSWTCQHCGDIHSGNLLKKIKQVEVEYDLTICQPDIALLDSENNVFAVIEIVVSHKPEENTLKFYSDNEIILIQIDLSSDQDLDDLSSKISFPNIVSICFNPQCKKCGHYQLKKIMTVIDGTCWKCDSKMKVANISYRYGEIGGYDERSDRSPSEFTDEEIAFAKTKGVLLRKNYSKTAENSYVSNSCRKCGAFAGEFYLHSQYIAPADCGQLDSQKFEMGYHCLYCYYTALQQKEESDDLGYLR